MRKVDPKLYDKKYFLTAVEGHQHFDNFLIKINPKFKKALKLANLGKSEKVLDIGCGRGEIVFYSALLYDCNTIGIDYSKDAISICNNLKKRLNAERDVRINFFHVEEDKLPFEDESFDVIFFLDIWEHMYPEQIDSLLDEFYRILKKKGRMIVHTSPSKDFFNTGFPKYTYYANFFLNKFIFKLLKGRDMARSTKNPRSEYEKVMHINEQTLSTLKASLEQHGFKAKVFVDDFFIMASSPIIFLYYLLCQPFYLPFLRKIFGEHIWSIVFKK